MIVSRGHQTGRASEERGSTFSGLVWGDPVLSAEGAPVINNVVFSPSARTHWHSHEHGQILIVTGGRGFAQVRGGDGAEIGPGDVVWFAPGEIHWHGAGADTLLVHLAISLGDTSWLDPVTSEDYAAALAAP